MILGFEWFEDFNDLCILGFGDSGVCAFDNFVDFSNVWILVLWRLFEILGV